MNREYQKNGSVAMDAEVVVIGGGLAGMCAPISAARGGATVILVQDRPVLGGNMSSEMQVGICGADHSGFAPARYVRETGLIEEIWLEHMHRTPVYGSGFHMEDIVFWDAVTREKNIRLLLNTSAVSAIMADDGSIAAVKAVQPSTEKEFIIHGKIFIDASGDSRVAASAGAEFRQGREGRAEFHESMAPEQGDSGTMGSSIFFTVQRMDHKVPFTPPDWAYDFPRDEDLPFRSMELENLGVQDQSTGFWWLEYGGTLNTIGDNEAIRDELYKIVFGVWDHMKNHGDHGVDNYDIVWMNTIPAKRESRRLVGDYIVNENDVRNATLFEDRVAYGGWPIDVHPPEGIFSKEPPCTSERLTDVWNIPFRSLYSRNVPNLMMAGRNLSVTHIALGSARVMATCALMGQAVGTAAQICIRHGLYPRDILASHIQELQQNLLKDDCYIKEMRNEDPMDLARTAVVRASSQTALILDGPGEFQQVKIAAQLLPVSGGKVNEVQLLLRADQNAEVTLRLLRAQKINASPADGTLLKEVSAMVQVGAPVWVSFDFHVDLGEDALLWVQLDAPSGVSWLRRTEQPPVGIRRMIRGGSDKDWIHEKGNFGVRLSPESHPYDGKNVLNGVARPEKWTNLWISDPRQELPQYLELEFPKKTAINTVCLTFDTNLDATIYLPAPWGVFGIGEMPTCIKDYDILGLCDGEWITLWQERGNYQRHRVHHFNNILLDRIRIAVLSTNGDHSARIYEIRCYEEELK